MRRSILPCKGRAMLVGRILYPVRTLGPGDRIGIWFSGCERRCPGCSNPELQKPDETCEISLSDFLSAVKIITASKKVDGFTLTGGDPFFQPEALTSLLPALNCISKDILVYTGLKYEEVERRYGHLLPQIGALIDGEYVEDRNRGDVLRGSDNQRLIVLREDLKVAYDEYLAKERRVVQNFPARDGFVSVGIHDPGYEKKLDEALQQKGLTKA